VHRRQREAHTRLARTGIRGGDILDSEDLCGVAERVVDECLHNGPSFVGIRLHGRHRATPEVNALPPRVVPPPARPRVSPPQPSAPYRVARHAVATSVCGTFTRTLETSAW